MPDHPVLLLAFAFFVSLLPIIVASATSYLKIQVVLSLFRNAIGAQQVPSGLIVMVLSFALSGLIMQAVWEKGLEQSDAINFRELSEKKPSQIFEQLKPIFSPWKDFLQQHAGEEEIAVLSEIGSQDGIFTLLVAFLLSELKEAFYMGLVVMLPFLLIDFIVANLLVGLGMYMFSPLLISLPLKIAMIVIFDFWQLLFQGLYYSYV